jgi:cytochrome P450
LPYSEAFIWETLPYSSIGNLSLVHKTTEVLEFHGYELPKGTNVVANLAAAHHHDPNVWGLPHFDQNAFFQTA